MGISRTPSFTCMLAVLTPAASAWVSNPLGLLEGGGEGGTLGDRRDVTAVCKCGTFEKLSVGNEKENRLLWDPRLYN